MRSSNNNPLAWVYNNKSLKIKLQYIIVFLCYVLEYTDYLKDLEAYKKNIHNNKKTGIKGFIFCQTFQIQ